MISQKLISNLRDDESNFHAALGCGGQRQQKSFLRYNVRIDDCDTTPRRMKQCDKVHKIVRMLEAWSAWQDLAQRLTCHWRANAHFRGGALIQQFFRLRVPVGDEG